MSCSIFLSFFLSLSFWCQLTLELRRKYVKLLIAKVWSISKWKIIQHDHHINFDGFFCCLSVDVCLKGFKYHETLTRWQIMIQTIATSNSSHSTSYSNFNRKLYSTTNFLIWYRSRSMIQVSNHIRQLLPLTYASLLSILMETMQEGTIIVKCDLSEEISSFLYSQRLKKWI